MGLALKHIQKTDSGSYRYRRRVPKDIVEIIDKPNFIEALGATEAEALRQYPKIHDAVERQIAAARRFEGKRKAASKGELGGLALREVVEERVLSQEGP